MCMRKILSVLLAAVLLTTIFGTIPAASAEKVIPVEIYTSEDLQKIADDPGGDYILMADLDMTGIPWKALDLNGG